MTEDPRTEAERLLSEWQHWAERKPLLVDVLAAAIEVQETDDASSGSYTEDQIEQMLSDGIDFSHAVTRLCERLSVLRDQPGEET